MAPNELRVEAEQASVADAFERLTKLVEESDDPAALYELAADAAEWATAAKDLKAAIATRLKKLGAKPQVVNNGGTLARLKTPPIKRFDNPAIVSALAARLADEIPDPEDGTIPPIGVVCETVARAVSECHGVSPRAPGYKGWKAKPLKDHGVKLADYEIEPNYGQATVELEDVE